MYFGWMITSAVGALGMVGVGFCLRHLLRTGAASDVDGQTAVAVVYGGLTVLSVTLLIVAMVGGFAPVGLGLLCVAGGICMSGRHARSAWRQAMNVDGVAPTG